MAGRCARRLRIRDTVVETVHVAMPMHSNPIGTLHGGIVLEWMVTASTLAAMRVARRPTVLAGMDHVFFLNPIRIGENAVFTSWVELVGRSSIEATTLVESEDPSTGARRTTTVAHMTHVAVDEALRPVPVGVCVEAKGEAEERLQAEALERRRRREVRIAGRREAARDLEPPRPLDPGYYVVSYRFAYPEDAVFHNALFAGKLLYYLDELAGIMGLRYARGPVVTAAVDATDFYAPIRVGDVIEVHAALTHVGRTSMEITLKTIARDYTSGEARHTTTSYFTVVHLGGEGRPEPVPAFEAREDWQRELLGMGAERRRLRLQLLRAFKESGVPRPP